MVLDADRNVVIDVCAREVKLLLRLGCIELDLNWHDPFSCKRCSVVNLVVLHLLLLLETSV